MLGLDDVTLRSSHVALLFLDLDDFKGINDTHGHDAGDHVIIEIARRLIQHTRVDDRVARFGGDEFVILCQQTTLPEAEALATRIAESVREPIGAVGHRVTASIGIVECSADTPAEEMIALADAAMYRAKQGGRNRISV
jgi:two-component system, chemotaxis family, sensor kinase Cph1